MVSGFLFLSSPIWPDGYTMEVGPHLCTHRAGRIEFKVVPWDSEIWPRAGGRGNNVVRHFPHFTKIFCIFRTTSAFSRILPHNSRIFPEDIRSKGIPPLESCPAKSRESRPSSPPDPRTPHRPPFHSRGGGEDSFEGGGGATSLQSFSSQLLFFCRRRRDPSLRKALHGSPAQMLRPILFLAAGSWVNLRKTLVQNT